MVRIRRLLPADEPALQAFLAPLRTSSMLILENLRAVGISDGPERHQGVYAGACQGDAIVGMVGHYWNNNILIQAPPEHVFALWRHVVEISRRPMQGLLGPADQVACILPHLEGAHIRLNETEILFSLDLAQLRPPQLLTRPGVTCRRIEPGDVATLTEWRIAYEIELLRGVKTPELRRACRASVERSMISGQMWVLDVDGKSRAMSGFNATLDDVVQVGGVYTPPAFRSRGYGRAVVAASLLDARAAGVEAAVLFTGATNFFAQHAYRAIGFAFDSDYHLLLLNSPWRPAS